MIFCLVHPLANLGLSGNALNLSRTVTKVKHRQQSTARFDTCRLPPCTWRDSRCCRRNEGNAKRFVFRGTSDKEDRTKNFRNIYSSNLHITYGDFKPTLYNIG